MKFKFEAPSERSKKLCELCKKGFTRCIPDPALRLSPADLEVLHDLPEPAGMIICVAGLDPGWSGR